MSLENLTVGDLFAGALLSVAVVYLAVAMLERIGERRAAAKRRR